jgi:flagellar protein FliO/FliZ
MHRMVMAASLLCSVAAQAASEASRATAKFADPGVVVAAPISAASSMGRMTLALLIVLAVLFAAAWAMRQFKLFNRGGRGILQVEQGINLGPKERAVLITVQGRRLLLGVAPGCVNLLLELPEYSPPVVAATDARQPASKAESIAPNFKDLFKRSMGL